MTKMTLYLLLLEVEVDRMEDTPLALVLAKLLLPMHHRLSTIRKLTICPTKPITTRGELLKVDGEQERRRGGIGTGEGGMISICIGL